VSDQQIISVIDDDEPFRESMRRLMRSLRYRVEIFSSAANFLASPRFTETACLIADVNMPEVTGLELFRHLIRVGRPIPTILLTAYPRDFDRVSALKEGVVCYLRKPIDEQNLAQCLRAALASGEAHEATS
jgi:FixJ family two-component response regulator